MCDMLQTGAMSLKLAFADTKNKSFDLSVRGIELLAWFASPWRLQVAPDITLAQLHRLVGTPARLGALCSQTELGFLAAEKQNVKGKVSLKLNGKPVGGSLTGSQHVG